MFFPLIVDTFGGWNGAALDVLSKLGRQVGKEEEEMVRHLRQRLSVILTRAITKGSLLHNWQRELQPPSRQHLVEGRSHHLEAGVAHTWRPEH